MMAQVEELATRLDEAFARTETTNAMQWCAPSRRAPSARPPAPAPATDEESELT